MKFARELRNIRFANKCIRSEVRFNNCFKPLGSFKTTGNYEMQFNELTFTTN